MKKAFNLKKALICVLVLVLCVATFVACNDNKDDQYDMTNLNNALQYVRKWADTHIPTSTTASFDLIATTLDTNGTKYDVTWTLAIKTEGVAADAITLGAVDTETNTVKVTVPDRAEQDIEFTLTATISADNHSVTRDWTIKVLKWELNTWQQYYEAAKGDSVTVQGVVTMFNSKKNGAKYNSLYAQNADGAFYVYSMTDDPADLGIQVGMTVEMSGTKDIYNGTHELTSTAVTVVDTTITNVEPKDITELLKAATSTEDDALVKLQGMLVKFDGAMVLEAGDNNYCYFSLGTLKTYIRPSTSSSPMTSDEVNAFIQAWGENNLHLVNASKVQATVYSGKFYVQPLAAGAVTFGDLATLTPAQELEFTKNNTSITTEIFANGTETLPLVGATFADVKIAWASSDATKAAIDVATGKVTYTYTYTDEPQTITLTATFTHAKDATLSATGTYTVNLNKPTAVTVAEFLAKEKGDTVYALTGFIAAANKKAGEAGAFVLLDSTGAVFSYEIADVTVGDKVTVYATRTDNYGVPQLGTVSVTKLAAETYTEPTPEDLDGTTIDLSELSQTTIGDMTGKYYKISGLKLYKDGSYNSAGTLKDGSTTEYNQVLSLYGYSDLFDEDLIGQDVFVYGYVRGFKANTYLTIQVVKVTSTLTDEQIVAAAHTALELSNNQFGANFTLPTEAANGVTISWASNNTAVVTIDGANATVTPPAADTQVKLTATLTKGSASQTKDFTVTITATVTQYKVSWTDTALTVKNGETALASEDKVDEGTTVTVTVAVPANKVLASFQVNGGTADTSVAYGTTFTVTVTSDTAIVVNYTDVTPVTVAEFLTKSVDTTTVYAITGFVSAQGAATGTEASFVISDSTGAVFSYAKFDVTVGEKVTVYANRAVNYGVPQLGTLHITKLAAETYTEPTATELDGTTLDLSTLSSDTIGTMTGKYYKITGLKLYANGTFKSAGTGSTGAYTQKLSLYGYDDLYDEALLDQEVVVYGYVRGCKTNSYLTIQVVKVTGVSDADKVEAAKADLQNTFTTTAVGSGQSLTLPLTGINGATIAWTSANTDVISINGATATVNDPASDSVVVKLTATLTVGTENRTVDFNITVTKTIPKFNVTINGSNTNGTYTVKNGDADFTGGEVEQNTQLVITATPSDDMYIAKVTVNGTAVTLTSNSYTATITDATTIEISFVSKYESVSFTEFKNKSTGTDLYQVTGVVTNIEKAAVYISDAEGNGLYVYFGYGKVPTTVEIGKQYTFGGVRGEYNGLQQLASPVVLATAEGTLPTAKVITENDWTNITVANTAEYVTLNNIEMKNGKYYLGETEITIYTSNASEANSSTLSAAFAKIENGHKFNLKNVNISWFKAKQIALTTADSIEYLWTLTASSDKSEIAVNATAQITVGANPTHMSSTAAEGVTYTSSSNDIATVDTNGLVTGVSAGDVTITVSSHEQTATVTIKVSATVESYVVNYSVNGEHGSIVSVKDGDNDVASGSSVANETTITVTVSADEDYRLASYTIDGTANTSVAGQTSFTLKITAATTFTVEFEVKPAEAVKHTLSFATLDARTSQDSNSQVWAADGITFTNSKGSSTSNVTSSSNPVRLYKGSTIKIECTNIVKIVFNFDSSSSNKYSPETTLKALSGVTTTVSGTVATVVLDSAQNVFEFSASDNQIRLFSIEVYTMA